MVFRLNMRNTMRHWERKYFNNRWGDTPWSPDFMSKRRSGFTESLMQPYIWSCHFFPSNVRWVSLEEVLGLLL